jgi:predicted nucleic acid-binding protein
MKALLDTNIIIHRETKTVVNRDIGILFKWLDKAKYTKCIHPITIQEIEKNPNKPAVDTLKIKLKSYNELQTTAPLDDYVKAVSDEMDSNENDVNDTKLLNEVYCERADILVTEDKKIHKKADRLGIAERVFNINSFLEKVVSENPDLVDYKVLSVSKKLFGYVNLKDTFFDSFREDYPGFDKWFNKKSEETAYITENRGSVLSFLYVKVEKEDENYSDITPVFTQKKRLKIGTFKVESNGVRLGERFLKIIFDNAVVNKVNEIYVTIFDKSEEQVRLIEMLKLWGFTEHGIKKSGCGEEIVLTRDFIPAFNLNDPKLTYPYISSNTNIFLCPIWPDYHTELLPDSILTTESPMDFVENEPHRNAIRKAYISRSWEKGLSTGDLIVFYRTGGKYKGVISTIGTIENIITGIRNEHDFILKCRKRSIFTNEELKKWWDYNPRNRPFIVNFLYNYSFPKRINLEQLIKLGIIKDYESVPRGFVKITKEQFTTIIKETKSDESIIVD